MLRADWLARTVTVAHVPTLGPVHPAVATTNLFGAVLAVGPGRFLSHAKDRRRASRKDETVLGRHTEHIAERTTIATLARRRGGRASVYHHARTPPHLLAARETVTTLDARYGAESGRVVRYHHAPPRASVTFTRIQLAPTGEIPAAAPDRPVADLDSCCPPQVRDSFRTLCALTGDGMAHLARCWTEHRSGGPVLAAVDGSRIVAAIGPMQTSPGPTGTRQMLRQYSAVLPSLQRGGYGRALRRAAQCWGHATRADYQLLQATPDGPADQLYRGEPVRPLGLVCAVTA